MSDSDRFRFLSSSRSSFSTCQLHQDPSRIRARRHLYAWAACCPAPKGPGDHPCVPADRADGSHVAAAGGAGSSSAGRDHARQRHHQGERGGDALRGRSEHGGDQGEQLRLPDLAVCADHAALGAGRGRTGRVAEPSRQAQPAHSVHHRPAHGAVWGEGRSPWK